jgi:hypothetical protein
MAFILKWFTESSTCIIQCHWMSRKLYLYTNWDTSHVMQWNKFLCTQPMEVSSPARFFQPLFHCYLHSVITERLGVAVTAPKSYSEGARLESQRGPRLSRLRFLRFSSVPPDKFRESTSITPRRIPSIRFPIHHPSIILPFGDIRV